MYKYNGVELYHGNYYWLMNEYGITIGEFCEDWDNCFSVIGDEEFYPPSRWTIISPVCLEHTTKFPSLESKHG
jgi:hypothetical protein